jgi:glycosyltransferase involved in cell wall biosynthesis
MISVCIATYNGSQYIEEQLYSILPQISNNDEIIISDDHSTDNTIELIQRIQDKRIKIVFNQKEKGYTSNFENVLTHATGDYIFLCDQDDIWEPDKIKYCIKQLQSYDFIVSDATLINKNGIKIADSFFEKRIVYKSFIGNLYKFGYLGCCMAFKKKILEKALPFPKDHQLCTHDNWLFLISKVFYKTLITSEKLIKYRRHTNNTSEGGLTNNTTIFFKIKYRFYLLFHLCKRAFNI